MVPQYHFTESLHEKRAAIKTAFHGLLIEYGNYDDKGEYSLDITKLKSPIQFLYVPCQRIIRSGCEIFFESYDEDAEDTVLTPICCYGIEQLAKFYDALATAMNKKLTEEK